VPDTIIPRRVLEEEATFTLSAGDVPYVARLLQAAPEGWAGAATWARRRTPRTVLHLYLGPASPPTPRRIRIKLDRRPPVLLLESKQLLREDQFVVRKIETTQNPGVSLEDAQALLTSPGAVISAFIKNQYKVRLRSDAGAFKASLDQVIPFIPRLPFETAAPEWHLEFEAGPGWSPECFLRSGFFTQSLAPVLRPLLISKWQLARMGPPAGLPARSAHALRGYLDTMTVHAIGTRSSWHGLAHGRARAGELTQLEGHR
jgi:hypothetical protein